MSESGKGAVENYQNYIDGQYVSSLSGETFPVYDLSTEEVIAHVASSGPANIDAAVKAAQAAFSGQWVSSTAQERGRILFKLASKVRQNAKQLSEMESRNSGKPIAEAEIDIADAATCFEYCGALATKVLGHVNPVPANALSFTMREPVGVSARIIPWNYPLGMAAWKLADLANLRADTTLSRRSSKTWITALGSLGRRSLALSVPSFLSKMNLRQFAL